MPDPKEPLLPERFYHIYNRGVNSCPIFLDKANCEYFLSLYEKHIALVADTYAWVLMGNHFHILVKIKAETEIANEFSGSRNNYKDLPAEKRVNQQFSNLFNAYAKAFNKKNDRTGGLFENPFKRKHVDTESYLKRVILYINLNPLHHRICSSLIEYPWSSYMDCVSVDAEKEEYLFIHKLFGSRHELIKKHQALERNINLLNSLMNSDDIEN